MVEYGYRYLEPQEKDAVPCQEAVYDAMEILDRPDEYLPEHRRSEISISELKMFLNERDAWQDVLEKSRDLKQAARSLGYRSYGAVPEEHLEEVKTNAVLHNNGPGSANPTELDAAQSLNSLVRKASD